MESARMYAWIVVVVLTAITLNLLAGGLERRASAKGEGVAGGMGNGMGGGAWR
jgi:hypothetical protein